jgi:hypothetical protein
VFACRNLSVKFIGSITAGSDIVLSVSELVAKENLNKDLYSTSVVSEAVVKDLASKMNFDDDADGTQKHMSLSTKTHAERACVCRGLRLRCWYMCMCCCMFCCFC